MNLSFPELRENVSCSGLDNTDNFKRLVYPAAYILIFVFGLAGHSLSICVFFSQWRTQKSCTPVNLLMVNLLVSDLMLVCSLPLRITYYMLNSQWLFGPVACQLILYVFYLNMYSSVYFLVALNVLRYLALARPYLYVRIQNHYVTGIVCGLIWVLMGLACSPLLFTKKRHQDKDSTRCLELAVDSVDQLLLINNVTFPEHSVVKKRSVAELAGKFSCPIPHTTDAEVNKPVRRRPPRTLQLSSSNDAAQGQDEKGAEPVSHRKNRNSALIEKLQANLALSPTGPVPFPKSPGVLKLPVPSFSPGSPSSPTSPPVTVTPKQEEPPASFENPSEGTVLKSIIKGRARHSIKRRPPSRRHRKSSADEEVDKTAPPEPTTPNGHEGDVFEEQKTSPDTESLSKEQIEQETKLTDSDKAEPEEKVETVTLEKKEEEEEKEEKAEQELKEEKSEAEPQLANSTEETHEEPETVPHGKPQTEPETTDEKEEEQKEDEVNN